MNRSVDEILDDLSYSMASPEAQAIFESIQSKNYAYAKKALKKYLENDEVNLVLNFYKKKHEQKYELVEIEVKDINIKDFKTEYLFKVGEQISKSTLEPYNNDDDIRFYLTPNFYKLKQAQQIWKIVIKES